MTSEGSGNLFFNSITPIGGVNASSWADDEVDMTNSMFQGIRKNSGGQRLETEQEKPKDDGKSINHAKEQSEVVREFYDKPELPRGPSRPIPDTPPFTIYVNNINYDVSESELGAVFENLKVIHVRIPMDRETRRSRGFGFVEFENKESLTKALEFDGKMLANRPIRCDVAPERKERQGGSFENRFQDRGSGENFQRRQEGNFQPRHERGEGFQQHRREDKFQPRNDRGEGFQQRRQEGNFQPRNDRGEGFQHHRREDKFQPRNDRGEGFQQRRQESKFQSRHDGGEGFQQRHEGGKFRHENTEFQRREERRDGGALLETPKLETEEKQAEGAGDVKAERPRLNLLPRTKPTDNENGDKGRNSNIFGAAKPRDESEYQKKTSPADHLGQKKAKEEVKDDAAKSNRRDSMDSADSGKDASGGKPQNNRGQHRRGRPGSLMNDKGMGRGGRGGGRGSLEKRRSSIEKEDVKKKSIEKPKATDEEILKKAMAPSKAVSTKVANSFAALDMDSDSD